MRREKVSPNLPNLSQSLSCPSVLLSVQCGAGMPRHAWGGGKWGKKRNGKQRVGKGWGCVWWWKGKVHAAGTVKNPSHKKKNGV